MIGTLFVELQMGEPPGGEYASGNFVLNMCFLSEFVSNEAIGIIFTPDVASNPNNLYIQRNKNN